MGICTPPDVVNCARAHRTAPVARSDHLIATGAQGIGTVQRFSITEWTIEG